MSDEYSNFSDHDIFGDAGSPLIMESAYAGEIAGHYIEIDHEVFRGRRTWPRTGFTHSLLVYMDQHPIHNLPEFYRREFVKYASEIDYAIRREINQNHTRSERDGYDRREGQALKLGLLQIQACRHLYSHEPKSGELVTLIDTLYKGQRSQVKLEASVTTKPGYRFEIDNINFKADDVNIEVLTPVMTYQVPQVHLEITDYTIYRLANHPSAVSYHTLVKAAVAARLMTGRLQAVYLAPPA